MDTAASGKDANGVHAKIVNASFADLRRAVALGTGAEAPLLALPVKGLARGRNPCLRERRPEGRRADGHGRRERRGRDAAQVGWLGARPLRVHRGRRPLRRGVAEHLAAAQAAGAHNARGRLVAEEARLLGGAAAAALAPRRIRDAVPELEHVRGGALPFDLDGEQRGRPGGRAALWGGLRRLALALEALGGGGAVVRGGSGGRLGLGGAASAQARIDPLGHGVQVDRLGGAVHGRAANHAWVPAERARDRGGGGRGRWGGRGARLQALEEAAGNQVVHHEAFRRQEAQHPADDPRYLRVPEAYMVEQVAAVRRVKADPGDVVDELADVGAGEGAPERGDLVQHAAEGPHVRGLGVGLPVDELRGEVVGRTAHRAGHGECVGELAAHAKVAELYVAVGGEEDVGRLDVPVEHVGSVHVAHGEGHLAHPASGQPRVQAGAGGVEGLEAARKGAARGVLEDDAHAGGRNVEEGS
mmetsp:Transcript_13945/g.47196  ORF Transcript_13945/g.47196 Transcript_13945/m.47196 type:complete len:472 (-) Transcript_13945:288-1703(-)